MRPAILHTWLSCLGGLAVLAGAALAAEPKAAGHDPEARRLLDEVVKAYQGLTAYSDQGEFVSAWTIDGRAEKQVVPLHLSLVRPDKVRLDAGPVRLVSDGRTMTTTVDPFKKYVAGPAPRTVTLETFREGPAGAMLFGGPSASATLIVTSLLVGEEPVKTLLKELGGVLKSEPDREAAGTRCRVLRIDRPDGPDFRLLVDPATRLLKEIDLLVDPKQLAESAAEGRKVAVERFGWTSGKVSTAAPRPETFAYQPPRGFTRVESFVEAVGAAGAGASKYRVNDLLDKPAPDFTLSVLDQDGKFQRLSRAELAGKVVLIDFWATWCGPCLTELPEIQKLIEAYARDKKDVVIVALSMDQRPSELKEVRKLVESTLERKQIKLTGTKVGKIALDPSGAIGEAFQVEYFPTVVVLDPKGVVRSAHIGSGPEIREVLTREIDTLLAGKPLAKPGAGEGTKPARDPE